MFYTTALGVMAAQEEVLVILAARGIREQQAILGPPGLMEMWEQVVVQDQVQLQALREARLQYLGPTRLAALDNPALIPPQQPTPILTLTAVR
jgi:hypothetical protein